MSTPARRKKFRLIPRPISVVAPADQTEQGLIVEGYAPSQMIEDFRT
jgi:hypothetical protein